MAKIPFKKTLRRSSIVGSVATQAAGKKLLMETKNIFSNAETKKSARNHNHREIAQLVFNGLSQLRGTALKLAQVFVGESGLLPAEYLAEFEKSHYKVPPLSSSLLKSVVRRELGKNIDELFLSFDWAHAKAASLGQVHKAVLKDGRPVAVKIQYPGIQEDLKIDFAIARKTTSALPQSQLLISIFNELEARIAEEIDYTRELKNMNEFKKLISSTPLSILVPKGYAELTTPRVLVMDWIEGQHIDQWVAGGVDKSQKNKVAQTLYDLFCKSVFDWKKIHVDPNFGNFIMTNEGSLALIDFGAVKNLSTEDMQFYKKLWTTMPTDNLTSLLEEYQQRGATTHTSQDPENTQLIQSAILPYLIWIQEFLTAKTFDFSQHSDFAKKGHLLFSRQALNPHLQNFSDQLTFVHRTLLGLFVIFTRLSATISPSSPVQPNGD